MQSQTKTNPQRQTTSWGLPEREGGGRWTKQAMGLHCMAMDENYTFGFEHNVVYTDIALECCTPQTYIML